MGGVSARFRTSSRRQWWQGDGSVHAAEGPHRMGEGGRVLDVLFVDGGGAVRLVDPEPLAGRDPTSPAARRARWTGGTLRDGPRLPIATSVRISRHALGRSLLSDCGHHFAL